MCPYLKLNIQNIEEFGHVLSGDDLPILREALEAPSFAKVKKMQREIDVAHNPNTVYICNVIHHVTSYHFHILLPNNILHSPKVDLFWFLLSSDIRPLSTASGFYTSGWVWKPFSQSRGAVTIARALGCLASFLSFWFTRVGVVEKNTYTHIHCMLLDECEMKKPW